MIIGILSDTHGHLERTQAACSLIQAHNPEVIVHCGDIGAEGVLIELAAAFDPQSIPVYAVLGNVDVYDSSLISFPDTTCVRVQEWTDFEIGNQRAAVIHGHDSRVYENAITSNAYAYVFTGHTHIRKEEKVGNTRVINPGAVYRAATPGCAVLNTNSEKLTYLNL